MRSLLAFSVLVALAAPALAQSPAESTGLNSALGLAPSKADFVKEAAISDMFEIKSSQAVLSSGVDPRMKDFARMMVEDHTKTTEQLKQFAQRSGGRISLPEKMDESHQHMLTALREKKDVQFTKMYFEQQLSAHRDAVALFQRYADGGDDPKLKQWAQDTIPTLQDHLSRALKLVHLTGDRCRVHDVFHSGDKGQPKAGEAGGDLNPSGRFTTTKSGDRRGC